MLRRYPTGLFIVAMAGQVQSLLSFVDCGLPIFAVAIRRMPRSVQSIRMLPRTRGADIWCTSVLDNAPVHHVAAADCAYTSISVTSVCADHSDAPRNRGCGRGIQKYAGQHAFALLSSSRLPTLLRAFGAFWGGPVRPK